MRPNASNKGCSDQLLLDHHVERVLTLAVQGKLVPQDATDEPASELLKKIRTEKSRLISEGKIKRDKPIPEIEGDEVPFLTPKTWEWAHLGDVTSYIQRGKSPTYADHSAHRVISQKCVRWYTGCGGRCVSGPAGRRQGRL